MIQRVEILADERNEKSRYVNLRHSRGERGSRARDTKNTTRHFPKSTSSRPCGSSA
ncbi:hypothetical protein PUN28_012697 [Cardiocondyla obscurior]|uniref:Uncharacterized protein n=1 Tax=Cardiocondyla obscurior TaxID=286306 RepID=A0AAW2FCZ2_9HYME